MKKSVFAFLAVVLVLFAVITLVKSPSEPVEVPGDSDTLTSARKENVRRFWATYRRATDHRMDGRMEAAADAYREALTLNEAHEDALYYLGNVLLELGHFENARQAWERLVHLNPTSARGHAQLGNVHFCPEQEALFDLEAAEAAFARALEINKEETGPLLRLGQVTLVQGDLSKAQDFFDAVTGSNHRSVDAFYLKGYIAWKRGATRQASTLLAQAVRLTQPETPPEGVPGEGVPGEGVPGEGVPGEGDTKAGAQPMTASTSRCQVFQPFIEEVTLVPPTELASDLDRWYQKLDAYLQQLRR
ncbi:MAG: tetratricopeptide repeat protein [Rhodothermales bacterium]